LDQILCPSIVACVVSLLVFVVVACQQTTN